jgi:hypothetical protein
MIEIQLTINLNIYFKLFIKNIFFYLNKILSQ